MRGHYLQAFLAGFGTFSAVYAVEAGLARAGLLGQGTLLDNALLGIFAGLCVLCFLRQQDASRELRRRRYHEELISHLNHHVRNALQLIVNRAELDVRGASELRDVQNAVNRIDWALREILPLVYTAERPDYAGNPPDPSPKVAEPSGRPPGPGIYPLFKPDSGRMAPEETGTESYGSNASGSNGDGQLKISVSQNKST